MENIIGNIITNSSEFIGGKTIVSAPMSTSIHGSTLASKYSLTSNDQTQALLVSAQHPPRNPLEPESSASILRANVSQMMTWLTSQDESSTQSQMLNASGIGSEYEICSIGPKIPKPYNELTKSDCVDVIAQAVRSIVLHTCNNDFRSQCFSKLGVTSSSEVQREIKTRLTTLLVLEEDGIK